MKNLPLMTVSGIRGIYKETIDEQFYERIAYVQTKLSQAKKVIIGRDTRPSGESLAKAIFRGVKRAGATPVDIGIAPTPTTCLATAHTGAGCGVIITASHNPTPYNGYKMVHRDGRLYNASECQEVYDAFLSNTIPLPEEFPETKDIETFDAVSLHIEKIKEVVDVECIKEAKLTVAIDSTNGAAGVIFPNLLEELGVRWVGVYNTIDGNFVHNPEPRPEHLTDLAKLLRETANTSAGFAFDPDADRLAPMGENGEPISEEMTLALALDNILAGHKSNIVTNLSTSMIIDDVAKKYGVSVIRSKIGEANVVEKMMQESCTVGGEGNGGIIYPRISTVRDGLAALALIIELLAKTGKTITSLVAQWPSYHIEKSKITLSDRNPSEVIEELAQDFSDKTIDTQDGLKIIHENSWVHVRPSNTEPILRCIAEASTKEEAQKLNETILTRITS